MQIIEALSQTPGTKNICVRGWVKTKRDSKAGMSFISMTDGSCYATLQVVAPSNLDNYLTDVSALTSGCAIKVVGNIENSLGKQQNIELHATSVELIGAVLNSQHYPIQAKRHSLEFLREVAHLRPRTNTLSAITRVRHSVSNFIHNYLDKQGFFWIHTPIITTNDCEGAGELFRVTALDKFTKASDFDNDFFGKETFLTVSGQLNVEAYCMALSKVYTFGPTFRAENSNTSRHLAEFWMIEPEMAFVELDELAVFCERMIVSIVSHVLANCSAEIDFFTQHVDKECRSRLENINNTSFEKITYTHAIEILQKANQKFNFPVDWGLDLQSEHERFICEKVFKKPVIITDYPKDIKSFYMRQNPDNKTVAALDILVPGIGEIIGGSQREERFDMLQQRMQQLNIPLEPLDWYLDLRRYGSVPHSGFGIGLERLLSYLSGISNIKDVIPFPRAPGQANY